MPGPQPNGKRAITGKPRAAHVRPLQPTKFHPKGASYMPSYHGLTAAEVETRRAAGQTNQPPRSQTKTTGEIVRDNICTLSLIHI